MTSGSQPFSKRADASVRSLSRRDDFTMPIGWNHAISSSTSVVASSISLDGAAHDPGDADRLVVAVADQQVVGGEAPLDVVEGHERLALAGRRAPGSRGPATLARS